MNTPHTAAGLAAAFSVTFWWVLAFAGVMLIPLLFLARLSPQVIRR